MGKRRYELDTHVLLVFLLVAIPFLIFGSLVVVGIARGQLETAMGEGLEQRALQTKVLLERYVGDQIVVLRLLSLDPQVRSAVGAAPRARRLDDAASGLAARLRQVLQARPALQALQVVDAAGRVVASSGRSTRAQQSETSWFRALARETEERPYVGDIQRLPGGGGAVLEVAYPMRDADDGSLQGAVRALVDASDLYGVLAPVRAGRTGHAVLVRTTDGLILASDDGDRVLRQATLRWSRYRGFNGWSRWSRTSPRPPLPSGR